MPDKKRVFTDLLSTFGRQNISQVSVFFCLKYLNEISDDDRIDVLKKVFEAAIAAKNEAVAREALEAIWVAYSWKEQNAMDVRGDRLYGKVHERAEAEFHPYLRNIFWKLPDGEEKRNPVFADLKLRILEFVSVAWKAEPTEESKEAFRFLCAAFDGVAKLGTSENPRANYSQEFRFVTEKEKKGILDFVRRCTDFTFDAKRAPFWLELEWVPEKFKEILVLARARNGGIALALGDIRNAGLLAGFNTLKVERSEAACEAIRVEGAVIATLDSWAQELIKEMKTPWSSKDKEIGQSEYVRAKLSVKEINSQKKIVRIGVKLYKGDSKELCQDVIGRARRHVSKFVALYSCNVVLSVESEEFPELNQEINRNLIPSV